MSGSTVDKPFAPAAARNAEPILGVLREAFADHRRLLEIGSGTGQHAAHCAAAMPWLEWQCSDVRAHLPGIRAWLDEAALPNTPPPIALDVNGEWPDGCFDAVFSANTLHILSWPEVKRLFSGFGGLLAESATLVIYGPFKRDGLHTAESNASFDAQLRAQDPERGIRDMADVDALAEAIGLRRVATHAMPANNFCLVWAR